MRSVLMGVAAAVLMGSAAHAALYQYDFFGTAFSEYPNGSTITTADAPIFGVVDGESYSAVYTVETLRGQAETYGVGHGYNEYQLTPLSLNPSVDDPVSLQLTIGNVTETYTMNDPLSDGSLNIENYFTTPVITDLDMDYGPDSNGVTIDAQAGFYSTEPDYGYIRVTQGDQAAFITVRNVSHFVEELSPEPEPATWLTLLVGVAMVGLTARRRQRSLA